jgi:ech hydrogenase subunit F
MSVFKMTGVILRNLFGRPSTRLYPFQPAEPSRAPGARGRIAIDIETCIFCMRCQKRCPTDAILVRRPEREWTIDRLRCCSCNACVEVCPVHCLSTEGRYSPVTVTRDKDSFRQKPRPQPDPGRGV